MRPITDRLSPVIKFLVVSSLLIFLFYVFAPANLRTFIALHLSLNPMVLAGDFWQPATALFIHTDPISFIFNMIGLWFVGADLERQLGTRRFLSMFFLIGIASHLVIVAWMLGFGTPLGAAGCGASLIALFTAFGTLYDRTPVRFFGALVLEARTLTAIMMGFIVLMDIAQRAWGLLVSHLVAMLMGYVTVGGRGEGLKRLWSSAHAKRVRRRYQVLEGGRRGTRPEDLN